MTWLFSLSPHPLVKLPSPLSLIGPDAESRLKLASELVHGFVFCMEGFPNYPKLSTKNFTLTPKCLPSPVGVLKAYRRPFQQTGASAPSQDTPPCTQDKSTPGNSNGFGQNCAAMHFYFWSKLCSNFFFTFGKICALMYFHFW